MKHFFTTRVKVVLIAAVILAVALAIIGNRRRQQSDRPGRTVV